MTLALTTSMNTQLKQNRQDLAYYAFTGCKVSGKYHGIEFSGIVKSRRWHSYNLKTVLVQIDLDYPITVFDQSRNGICLEYTEGDFLSDSHYIDYIDPSTYPNKG